MFLIPLWWLQPLLDNLSCLAFNTYLALLSHEALTALSPRGGSPQRSSQSLSLAQETWKPTRATGRPRASSGFV